jgi:Mn-dependent DtxR family transcriptional regulator
MIPLTSTESAALKVIRRWQEKYKNSPTPSELAQETDCSTQTTRNVLERLQEKGYIELAQPDQRILIVPLYWE